MTVFLIARHPFLVLMYNIIVICHIRRAGAYEIYLCNDLEIKEKRELIFGRVWY